MFKASSEVYNTLQRHVHKGEHPELTGLDVTGKKEKIKELWEGIKRLHPSKHEEALQEIVNKYKIPPNIRPRKRSAPIHGYFHDTPHTPKRLKTSDNGRQRQPTASLSLPSLIPPPLLNKNDDEIKLEPLPINNTNNHYINNKTPPSIPLPYPEVHTKQIRRRKHKSNEQKFADMKKRVLRELIYDKLCDMIHIERDMTSWYCKLCRKAGIKGCGVDVCKQVTTKRIVEHCKAFHHVDRLDIERKRLNAERIRAEGGTAQNEWLKDVKQTKTRQRAIHNDYDQALAATARYEQEKYVNSLKAQIENKNAEIVDLKKQNEELLQVLDQTGVKHEHGHIVNENVNEFKHWLNATVKLPQYFDKFLDDGFDDLMVIKETMNEGDLMRIGINKTGHRRKFIIFIKKLREES